MLGAPNSICWDVFAIAFHLFQCHFRIIVIIGRCKLFTRTSTIQSTAATAPEWPSVSPEWSKLCAGDSQACDWRQKRACDVDGRKKRQAGGASEAHKENGSERGKKTQFSTPRDGHVSRSTKICLLWKVDTGFSQEVATFESTFRSFLYGAIYQSDICAFAVQFCISKAEESGTKNEKRERLNGWQNRLFHVWIPQRKMLLKHYFCVSPG